MTFLKRLGPAPLDREMACVTCQNCPDIWELEDGDFAVIGHDITHAAASLPPSAGCGPNERMVRIPRQLLLRAKQDIPDSL